MGTKLKCPSCGEIIELTVDKSERLIAKHVPKPSDPVKPQSSGDEDDVMKLVVGSDDAES